MHRWILSIPKQASISLFFIAPICVPESFLILSTAAVMPVCTRHLNTIKVTHSLIWHLMAERRSAIICSHFTTPNDNVTNWDVCEKATATVATPQICLNTERERRFWTWNKNRSKNGREMSQHPGPETVQLRNIQGTVDGQIRSSPKTVPLKLEIWKWLNRVTLWKL